MVRWPNAMLRRMRICFGVLFATLTLISVVFALGGPTQAQTSSCGTIQGRVNNAAAGSIVDLPDGCVYRETVTIGKPLTLRGGPGVEIRGSNVWTGWTKPGSYWVKGTLPHFTSGSSTCQPNTSRCKWPEQVFFDGKPLVQVASNPRSGQFAVDGSRRVVLANDPSGHRVEVSVRRSWVLGRSGGVTIEGLTMKHAANPSQIAPISNNSHANWTVRNNDLSWAHGVILSMNNATGLSVLGNKIHHAGRVGITSVKANLVVSNNEINDNNTEQFFGGWYSGGIKVSDVSRLVFDNNQVHHNSWYGVWVDEGSQNATISNNRIHHNSGKGVQFEISDHGKIFGNVVWENGWGASEAGGIHAVASRNVEIYNNTLAWNGGRSIRVLNSDRPQGNGTVYDLVNNVLVHHNTILARDPSSGTHHALEWMKTFAGGNLYNLAAGNRGYDNRYWYGSSEGSRYRYYWNGKIMRVSAFNLTLGEERGRYLSDSEKQQLTAAKNIPPSPESH